MAACSILQFVGCEKQDEVQVLVDTDPTPVYFVVKDAEGNNLLDVDYDGNILNNDIEITVNGGEIYGVAITEVIPDGENRGLYLSSIKVEDIDTPCLEYWFIHHPNLFQSADAYPLRCDV